MTVRDLLDKCDSMEITEWIAFFQIQDNREAQARKQTPGTFH